MTKVVIGDLGLLNGKTGKVREGVKVKRYIVYLDVLGYSDNLKRNSSTALEKIQKFYSVVAEKVKAPDQNIWLISQLIG